MNRKIVLVGGILFLLCSRLSSWAVTLSASGVSLTSLASGSIQILDGGGTTRATISGYTIPLAGISTSTGTASLITLGGGQQAIQVVYSISGGTATVRSQFTVSPYRVHIHFDVTGSSSLDLSTSMMLRQILSPTTPQSVAKLALWQRDANGGVPYEVPDTNVLSYGWTNLTMLVLTPGANLSWNDSQHTHLPGVPAGSGVWTADADLSLMNARPSAGAALIAGRPLSIDLWTAQPFNLWSSGSTLSLNAQAANTSAATKTLTLNWWARDFGGTLVSQSNSSQSVGAGQAWTSALSFPAPTRGILFVEVSVSDGTNTAFARTHLALLPPHIFSSGDESVFGLSAAFGLPSTGSELGLLQRMGVRWMRGLTYSLTDAETNGLAQSSNASTAWTSAAPSSTWIDAQLAAADSRDALYWEVGNEMNSTASSFASGSNAALYVGNFLSPARARQIATGASVGIMSGGLAGMDTTFAANFYAAGGWSLIDAFALHPGRGNFTADYPGENGQVSSPNFWNFLGAIRKANSLIDAYGTKPLCLTEAYACTLPNNYWVDGERHAAENVLLQYALAMEEGVQVMYFYQLNDSAWNDVGGANATDSEYHYGLLDRDLSPKPSLLAYCTAAEALDQASFEGWILLSDPNAHGLMFDTPRGPMAILWHRADGYLQSANTTPYAAPEAWVDPWPTKTVVSLPTASASATVIDCIGRQTSVAASGGAVSVTLDGAPRVVYGLGAIPVGAVVDNANPVLTAAVGSWMASVSGVGYYGSNYLHDNNAGKGMKQFTFAPNLGSAGNYQVYARWTASANRATNVPITVAYDGGTATVTVNQQSNGGTWVSLGTYPFVRGRSGTVTISNAGTNGYVIADAIEFVKQ